MHRNLDRRVEVLVRILDRGQVEFLTDLLDRCVAPTTSSWHLLPDGTWERHQFADDGTPLEDLQQLLIARARRRVAASR